ncbi:MAG: hypothetical protein ACR2KK_01265 [Acidimicrobiales bacterium]
MGQALSTQPFTAYGAGDAIALGALALGPTQLAGLRVAASGGSVNSGPGGLTAITNEFGQNVGPARADRNAYGRGTAIEAGVLTATPQPVDLNQIILSGLAEAYAPPPSPLVVQEIAIPVNPLLYASTARGEAKATFDPVFCPVGRPLSYGRGFVENLELLGSTQAPDGSINDPLLGTSISAGNQRATTQSRTVTYLISNGDGTFGLVSETRQTVAPISVAALGGVGGLTIEIAGEFGLRAIATGKPGGASVAYTGNPLISVSTIVAGVVVPVIAPITLQQIIGQGGIGTPPALAALLSLSLGQPPRALKGPIGSTAAVAPDGTSASGAVDLLRLTVLGSTLDLGVAHMEGSVTVPAGGIKCSIPVSKVASVDPVSVGADFSYVIKIPSDAALFNALFNCDLIGISAVDTVTTESGTPRIQLLSASNGGVISGNTVTWANLGNYVLGQEPITLTINARIPNNSGPGVLRDTVNVSASLGNCRGGVTGEDIIQGNNQIVGIARLDGTAITGNVTLIGPNVAGDLAATGGNSWPLVAGGGFLLAALGLVRLRRRATEVPTKS